MFFLPAGDYKVIVSEIEAVATCFIEKVADAENAVLESKDNLTVPVTYGFTLLNSGERSAEFTADGSSQSLYIEIIGSETYYDSVHTAQAVITDSEGNVVLEEICEETYGIDITDYIGEYIITIIPNATCMVEITVKDN